MNKRMICVNCIHGIPTYLNDRYIKCYEHYEYKIWNNTCDKCKIPSFNEGKVK